WLATAARYDHTARLWDLTEENPVPRSVVLRGHESQVAAVAISSDGHWLLTGGGKDLLTGNEDNTARLWDLSAKDPAASSLVLRGHDGEVSAVAISTDNRWLVTGSADRTARLWDLKAQDPAARSLVLHGHESSVFAETISLDNHWLVTGSWDGAARLWD